MTIQAIIDYVENRYDAENDAANVSWVDMRLLEAIEKLMQENKQLSDRVNELESAVFGDDIDDPDREYTEWFNS